MSAVHHCKITMDIHPVTGQQLINMSKRHARHAFCYHLRATRMMSLNHVFRIVCLLEQAEDFPVKLVGANVLAAAMCSHP